MRIPWYSAFPVLLLAAACSSTPAEPPTIAELGALEIRSSTRGDPVPGLYYALSINGLESRFIGLNSSLTLQDITPGSYQLELSGTGQNCAIQGSNPLTVTVSAGAVTRALFVVLCSRPSSIRVKVTSDGGSPDPDGYVVGLTGQSARAVGSNAEIAFEALPAGTYSVYLSGLAFNCLVAGTNVRTITLGPGVDVLAEYHVSCPTLAPGSLLIAVSTRAIFSPFNDRFVALVDTDPGRPIPANGFIVINPITAGLHSVKLTTNYPGSCFIAGPGGAYSSVAQVTVPQGGSAKVAFSVLCVP